MMISEKQIMQLLNQLRDHISLYERLSLIGMTNRDYFDWLCDLRNEITNQQPTELKVIE